MLVLSRLRDETIMIGDDVEITVVDIRGDKVRLGISAPARVAVHRKEVYEAIRAENEQAARAAGAADIGAIPMRAPLPRAGRSSPAPRPPGDTPLPAVRVQPVPATPVPARKRA